MTKHPPVIPLFLTDEKKKSIYDEISDLENAKLPKIRRRLADAYADGDIPENNPFITAHEDLQLGLKRLNELRELLMRAKAYKAKKSKGYKLGDKVTLTIKNKDKICFTLVEPEEADPINAKLSIKSPYGKAVVGKRKNDNVEIITPAGKINGKIV